MAHVDVTAEVESPQAASVAAAPAAPAPGGSPWIYRPWIDLLIGCGGWSAPLLLTAWIAASRAREWAFAFYFLALIFNYPHFMATIYRAYRTREEFQKYRIFTLHITALLALTAILAHADFRLVPWVFTLYIDWSPWHYSGQNYGLLMMFARRGGTSVTQSERRLLHWAFIASYVMLLVSFHTGVSNDPFVLSLNLPAKISIPARVAGGVLYVFFSGWVIAAWVKRGGWKGMAAPLTLLVTQALWFVLPTALGLVAGAAIPQTRYSSGILAVLHSAQYLWITSYYARREARAAGNSSWRMSTYFVTLIAGGIALFIPGPWLVSYAFHYDFAVSFLIFTALVNIHHFILDGAIWKLRDSRIASVLVGRSERREAEDGAKATSWLGGRSAGAHAFRVAVASILFLLGGMDQIRYFTGTDEGNLPHLLGAASQNPYDSSLEKRIARAESQAGQTENALAAFTRAVEVNPSNPVPQEARARALLIAGRYQEAYEHYQKMLARFPRNADALVNYGLLAMRLGHSDEAVESWEKAIDADPAQPNAQLYVAEALDHNGEHAAAARHYQAYLDLALRQTAEGAAPLIQRAAVTLELADALAHSHQANSAIPVYRDAVRLAQQAANVREESLAESHLADALDAVKLPADAAAAYQQAIALDERSGDTNAEAVDWFNYGQVLSKTKLPLRFAYACFVRAEELLSASPGPQLDTVTKTRREA
ncbi:MAG: tetratricopeptide repeat protein, partial [Candidatus Acidiferrales bacterium]